MSKRSRTQTPKRSGTALNKYQRLEALGLWRERPEDHRREVVVRMGEATLTLSDPRSESALSHWSLPAVVRVNPGQEPAVFSPAEDSPETIEITDEDMLNALHIVQNALRAARPHPGRLRGWLLGGMLGAVVLGAFTILPSKLISHTAKTIPAQKHAELGQYALDDVTRLTGQPCDGEFGLPALARLSERLFGPNSTPILYILPEGLKQPGHLPGAQILLPQALLNAESPDVLAGAALVEALKAHERDPMQALLRFSGLPATFGLLTSGHMESDSLKGYGAYFLDHAGSLPDGAAIGTAFAQAKVSLTPYAKWLEAQGQDANALLAIDPFAGQAPAPLLSDDDWLALQSVCKG